MKANEEIITLNKMLKENKMNNSQNAVKDKLNQNSYKNMQSQL